MTLRSVRELTIQLLAFVLVGSTLAGCGGDGSPEARAPDGSAERSWHPKDLADGWPLARAEELDLNGCVLDSMTAAIDRGEDYPNVHALIIAKDNQLVYEQYFTGRDRRYREGEPDWVTVTFHPDTLHDSRSVAKSVTSALVGIALGAGAISSLDVPIAEYFPEQAALSRPELHRITLRHALTMSAGLDWNENDIPYTDASNHETIMGSSDDPVAVVLNRSAVAEPGATWAYNGGLTTLLGVVVSRATGRPFGDYAREELFNPLGIDPVEWGGPPAWSGIPELQWKGGEPWARSVAPFGALWMRPRDFAKFGSLYLTDGRWQGEQVLPVGWVAESTQKRYSVRSEDSDQYGEFGYGYSWWHNLFRTPQGDVEVHTAVGNGEQRIYVVPSQNVVVVHLAGLYNQDGEWMSERLLLDYVFPAANMYESAQAGACF